MQLQSSHGLDAEYKHQIACRFGQATSTYADWASVQKGCAEDLVFLLKNSQHSVPEGRILEVGCGTGFVTQELIDHFPDRQFQITDISQSMLEHCQNNLSVSLQQCQSLSFQQMDGEAFIAHDHYAAIVSGFVVQWFEQPLKSLQHLIAALKPGGLLLFSFPTQDSFPEWKYACSQLGLPFTANPLPDPHYFCKQFANDSLKYSWSEKQVCLTYESAIAFFKSLKLIGATLSRSQRHLSPKQMKQLIQNWDQAVSGQVQIHYHVAFLVVQHP